MILDFILYLLLGKLIKRKDPLSPLEVLNIDIIGVTPEKFLMFHANKSQFKFNNTQNNNDNLIRQIN